MKKTIITIALISGVTFIGCTRTNNDGQLERAGERLDEAVENVKDGESPFKKKGTMEKLGEKVDEQFEGSKK